MIFITTCHSHNLDGVEPHNKNKPHYLKTSLIPQRNWECYRPLHLAGAKIQGWSMARAKEGKTEREKKICIRCRGSVEGAQRGVVGIGEGT